MNNFNQFSSMTQPLYCPNTLSEYLSRWKLFLITPSLLLLSIILHAQCSVHTIGTSNFDGEWDALGDIAGQTFQACQTGDITSISIGLGGDAVANTNNILRIGAITPPVSSVMGIGTYQTFNTPSGAGTLVITLSTPFPVIAGNNYAFEVENGGGNDWNFLLSTANDYADGNLYQDVPAFGGFNSFSGAPNADLDFEVNIQPSSSSSTDVPTLSEWGLIILALLLMTLGTLYLVQPNWRESRLEQSLPRDLGEG